MPTKKTDTKDTGKDAPAVLAYRVGQLEIAVSNGFTEVKNQLINLQHDFATKNELATVKREAEVEHDNIRKDIQNVSAEVVEVDTKVEKFGKRNWVQNTLSAILGAVLAILISYFFANIIK